MQRPQSVNFQMVLSHIKDAHHFDHSGIGMTVIQAVLLIGFKQQWKDLAFEGIPIYLENLVAIFERETVTLKIMHVIENNRIHHSEVINSHSAVYFNISFDFICFLPCNELIWKYGCETWINCANVISRISAGAEDYRNINKRLKWVTAGYCNHILRYSLFHILHSTFQKTNPFLVWISIAGNLWRISPSADFSSDNLYMENRSFSFSCSFSM